MTEAIFGIVGILIGGLLSGVVQVYVAERDRKNAARAAARLLYSDIYASQTVIQGAMKHGGWWRDGILPPLDGWNRHLEPLAAGMAASDFHVIAGAASHLRRLEFSRKIDVDNGTTDVFTQSGQDLADALDQLKRATAIVAKAGLAAGDKDVLAVEDGR